MKRNSYKSFFKKKVFFWHHALGLMLAPLFAYGDSYNENCSYNPVSECMLNARLDALLADIETAKGDPIFVYANVNSNLKPETVVGPTNYKGSGTIVLTLTNNSLHLIDVECVGKIYMKGYQGPTITNANYTSIQYKPITISGKNLQSGNGPIVLTQDVTGFSSSGMNLWEAALGTQPNDPLHCKITFIMRTKPINPVVHVYLPVPYS